MGQKPGCCGAKCGQPAVVSIGEDLCPNHPELKSQPGLSSSADVPDWLSALAPSLEGQEAERAAEAWVKVLEDLRRRTRRFVRSAVNGISCRVLDRKLGKPLSARYFLDETLETLSVERSCEAEPAFVENGHSSTLSCNLANIRNIWVCSDSELARRAHGSLRSGKVDADLACIMLIDAPLGPITLVERSAEAREEFLDCMAVLIAAQRLRSSPEAACCKSREGPPPPEARLRPLGKSLQSVHVSGPICTWLAQAAAELVPGLPSLSNEVDDLNVSHAFAGSRPAPTRAYVNGSVTSEATLKAPQAVSQRRAPLHI